MSENGEVEFKTTHKLKIKRKRSNSGLKSSIVNKSTRGQSSEGTMSYANIGINQ